MKGGANETMKKEFDKQHSAKAQNTKLKGVTMKKIFSLTIGIVASALYGAPNTVYQTTMPIKHSGNGIYHVQQSAIAPSIECSRLRKLSKDEANILSEYSRWLSVWREQRTQDQKVDALIKSTRENIDIAQKGIRHFKENFNQEVNNDEF
jgi:hypothetical protein